MKNTIRLLITLAFLVSCSDDDNPTENKELVSKWKLTETYWDIGDGRGEYHPIESNLIIEFYDDGTVTTNETICSSTESDTPESGTYSLDESIITLSECTIHFEMEESILILNYPQCVEPCFMKFIKIE